MKSKKFSFAFYGGATYAFRNDGSANRSVHLSLNPSESYHDVAFPSSRERGAIAKNAGFYVEFRVRKNLFLNLGLNYSQVFYQTKNNTTFYITSKGNASPNTFYATTNELQIKERYYFLSVPICVSYRLHHKKFAYSFGGGLSLGAYRNEIIEGYGAHGTTYDQTPRDFNDKRMIQLTGAVLARFGIYHTVGKYIVIGLEPEYKYYMLSEGLSILALNLVIKF